MSFDYKTFLASVPNEPGVYSMLSAQKKVLYVGKAKRLSHRLKSYFQAQVPIKTAALVRRIAQIELVTTQSETEALLLEQTLIKAHKPPYNILFRDDKSYPFIYLSQDEYPQLGFHRGKRTKPGRYFGPYPSSGAVRETLVLLQKMFAVRQCDDTYFQNRSRPCLQYQMKRCKAPCMNWVDRDEYQQDVKYSVLFLEGKNQQLTQQLQTRMDTAATALQYEKAAHYRDKISRVRQVQEQQVIQVKEGNVDVIGIASESNRVVVGVLFVRGGRVLGYKYYRLKPSLDETLPQILSSFLAQYYITGAQRRDYPEEAIIPNIDVDTRVLSQVISKTVGRTFSLLRQVRSQRKQWQQMIQHNAEIALAKQLAEKRYLLEQWQKLSDAFDISRPVARIECFDISHTLGEATIASCVVFDQNGPRRADYRRFNITGITPGDDYAAMHQALEQRYKKIQHASDMPDIILIDGGLGQLKASATCLEKLSLLSAVTLLGVAKGITRKPGMERLLLLNGHEIVLEATDDALLLIQRIRDEAHRFAITGHRNKREKARRTSTLEQMPGIGVKRRLALLRHFGGLQGVLAAPISELEKVAGISHNLAQQIHHALHQ